MAIDNTTRKTVVMLGDGSTVDFPFAFRINNEEDLKVYVKIGPAAYALQALGVDYDLVDLQTDTYGNITGGNIRYPKIGAPITADDSIYAIRETPNTQLEDSSQVSFQSKDVERALDKATMEIQELTEEVDRCLKVEAWQDISPDDILNSVYQSAADAAVSATNAHNSELSASGSANNAATSETNAQKWAEGSDADVTPLGGTHSSKGWADEAASHAADAASAVNDCQAITDTAVASINRPLLSFMWTDHLLNNQSWLRADTNSWQDGTVYTEVYNHLFAESQAYITNDISPDRVYYRDLSRDDIVNGYYAWSWVHNGNTDTCFTTSATPTVGDTTYAYSNYVYVTFNTVHDAFTVTTQSETIAGNTINYILADDGHKIVSSADATTVDSIYTATGVAWYYVIDTTNKKFKLPRTQWGLTGYRDAVGKYVSEKLVNEHYHAFGANNNNNSGTFIATNDYGVAVTLPTVNNVTGTRTWNGSGGGGTFNATGSAYAANMLTSLKNDVGNKEVQQRATQMYLYFYVGNFTESATQQTAGLNSELFNHKVDLDAANLSDTGKSLIAGLGMPSTVYEDISLGVSGTQYTAPANGYFVLYVSSVNPVGYIYTENLSTHFRCETRTTVVGTAAWAFCSALKGEKVAFNYDVGGTVNFKFHYAEGSKSEA